MSKTQLPASGGRWLRDDKGALHPADPAEDTPAKAETAAAGTPPKGRVKET